MGFRYFLHLSTLLQQQHIVKTDNRNLEIETQTGLYGDTLVISRKRT